MLTNWKRKIFTKYQSIQKNHLIKYNTYSWEKHSEKNRNRGDLSQRQEVSTKKKTIANIKDKTPLLVRTRQGRPLSPLLFHTALGSSSRLKKARKGNKSRIERRNKIVPTCRWHNSLHRRMPQNLAQKLHRTIKWVQQGCRFKINIKKKTKNKPPAFQVKRAFRTGENFSNPK